MISIQDISFSDVAYALTDTDFGNVATVDITYADANGETVERTVNLAEVQRCLAMDAGCYAGRYPRYPGGSRIHRAIHHCLFHRAVSTSGYVLGAGLLGLGPGYRPPVDMIGVRVPIAETGCGPITESQIDEIFAYYCTRDETIYYNPNARDDVIEHLGQAAWDMVISTNGDIIFRISPVSMSPSRQRSLAVTTRSNMNCKRTA